MLSRPYPTISLLLVLSMLLGCAGPARDLSQIRFGGQPAPAVKTQDPVKRITPAQMTVEEKKPYSPVHQSGYVVEDIGKIPTIGPREEALEGREEYYLGYHDMLRITIFGRQDIIKEPTDIVREVEIRDDGKISYPLIGDLQAAGLTIPELQDRLVARLGEYIAAPKVDIQITKYASRNVSILGEVAQPRVMYLSTRTTILEAIAAAGGLKPTANLKDAYMVRQNKIIPLNLYDLMVDGNLLYNVELKRKDIIYIPNVQDLRVYVIGEVKAPKVVPFAGRVLTVAEAIASAGDFKSSAKQSNLKVIRGGLEQPTIITVDFEQIVKGNFSENIALHSEDIVFAPASLVGEWNKILELITPSLQLLLFARTVNDLVKD
jgi:polysaccharide export outer membrane protein